MRPALLLAVSLLTLLTGCSSAPAPDASSPAPAGSGSAAASAVPPAGSEYFYGTSQIFPIPAEGALPVATRHVLVRRSVDPATSRIVEDVVTEGRKGTAEEFVTTMTVAGATFTMEERGNAFRGTGTLTGDPWRWTAWTSHSVMPDGATVDSRDQLSEAGLHVEKEYRGSHGSVRMVEQFTRIDRAAYQARRAALGVAPDPTP